MSLKTSRIILNKPTSETYFLDVSGNINIDGSIFQNGSLFSEGIDYQGWNGITVTDNSIGLGGTLSSDTVLQGNNKGLQLDNFSLLDVSVIHTTDPSSYTRISSYSYLGFLQIATISGCYGNNNAAGILFFGYPGLPASMQIYDTLNNKGIEYESDYSANYTARSLVDKAWIEGYVDACLGGATVWGNITGDISNQTDLWNILSDLSTNRLNTAGGTISGDLQIDGSVNMTGNNLTSLFLTVTPTATQLSDNANSGTITINNQQINAAHDNISLGNLTDFASYVNIKDSKSTPDANLLSLYSSDTQVLFQVKSDGAVYCPSLGEASTNYLLFIDPCNGLISYNNSIQLTTNAGAVNMIDMGITADVSSGTEESYSFNIDGSSAMKIYATANGSGGVLETAVVVEADYQYMGDPTTDGSWRFYVDASLDLVFERRETGSWVEQGKFP